MRRRALVFIIVAAGLGYANATTAAHAQQVTTFSGPKCWAWKSADNMAYYENQWDIKKLSDESKAQSKDFILNQRHISETFIQGYVDAYVIYTAHDILKGVTFDDLKQWVSKYCAIHSESSLIDAAQAFIKQVE